MTAAEAHAPYMRRCLDLARRALTAGDAPVGALLVHEGTIAGEGLEGVRAHHDVTAHAEIVALREACARLRTRDLSGSTLYTTVEPCIMCAYAIRLARVGLVVTGTASGDAEWAVNGAMVLAEPRILPGFPPVSLLRGVLEAECRALVAEARRRPDAGRRRQRS